MTLHEAIFKILEQKGGSMTIQEVAEVLNNNKWYQKKDNSIITAFQIHGRTKKYSHLFNRNGSNVSLAGQLAVDSVRHAKKHVNIKTSPSPSNKDEHYVLDLCDKILGLKSSRQHKFDFLRGDMNTKGKAARLPVDAFYKELSLVVEYRERQHTEAVNFFDKPERMTISGKHRGEQRKDYDERRRVVIPQHNMTLIEISYLNFNHDNQKRIIRSKNHDEEVVKQILQAVKKKINY